MELNDLFNDFARLTVSQYTAEIKRVLESRIAPCWIVGEVSNLRRQSSGHIYFSLKDAGAQLPAVMFRGQARALGFKPTDGMEVVALGEISVYEPHGRYQLIVREMQESGQGRLFREFERLKRKLADEGLFASERKRPLPALPLKVAIVTSPTGAALQDFTRILTRRNWGGRLVVVPVKVQGMGAAEEIAEAIELVNRMEDFDVLVVARGGGSIEDLWPFNEEIVARAVSESAVPVISGVGHEIDFTLSDFAADVRAETPSAAAEIITSSCLACIERLEVVRDGLLQSAVRRIQDMRAALDGLRSGLRMLSPTSKLEKCLLRLDDTGSRLFSAFRSGVHEKRGHFVAADRRYESLDIMQALRLRGEGLRDLTKRLEARADAELRERRRTLDLTGVTLQAISPAATLKRGFAILESSSGAPLTSARQARGGERVSAVLTDGTLDLKVEAVSLSEEED